MDLLITAQDKKDKTKEIYVTNNILSVSRSRSYQTWNTWVVNEGENEKGNEGVVRLFQTSFGNASWIPLREDEEGVSQS